MASDEIPKLRMAAPETPEQLQQRAERERRAVEVQREYALEKSISPFRVGSVNFLNAAPLVRGIEDEIALETPAKLAELLRANKLDAGLVSITEVLFNDLYDILDGIAIASLGEVKSVFLAHKKPVGEIREVYCDTASLTSVNLLKILLAERGLKPEFKPLPDYAKAKELDYVLLIGDAALDFIYAPHEHTIMDLGAAWMELTQLPFVYAVWALRRDLDTAPLRRMLREARDFGLDTLDNIIRARSEYDYEFRKDYLGWHIHYHLGSDEKRGIARFIELLRKHSIGTVHDPRFVF